MTSLHIIRHNDILFRDILRAVMIKNKSWPHPVESQLKWIIDNMQPDDMHMFLKDGEEDIAYMTLSPVTAVVNGVETSLIGVGCVCTSKHGVGFGKRLMESVDKWLIDNNHKGLLFCKKELISFYMKYGWSLIEPTRVLFITPHNEVYTMSFNCEDIKTIEYNDRLF